MAVSSQSVRKATLLSTRPDNFALLRVDIDLSACSHSYDLLATADTAMNRCFDWDHMLQWTPFSEILTIPDHRTVTDAQLREFARRYADHPRRLSTPPTPRIPLPEVTTVSPLHICVMTQRFGWISAIWVGDTDDGPFLINTTGARINWARDVNHHLQQDEQGNFQFDRTPWQRRLEMCTGQRYTTPLQQRQFLNLVCEPRFFARNPLNDLETLVTPTQTAYPHGRYVTWGVGRGRAWRCGYRRRSFCRTSGHNVA